LSSKIIFSKISVYKSRILNLVKNKKIFFIALVFVAIVCLYWKINIESEKVSGAPPYGESEDNIPALSPWEKIKKNWQRPKGPAKVGLQVGHLDNDQLPDELENLRKNSGASAVGYTEAEINSVIAEKTAEILREEGIIVDILPATIPPGYWADVFLAIHADGSTNSLTSGFKIASPWRDLTGKSNQLVQTLEQTYQEITKLSKDPNISHNMRGYYAFSWWKYKHSIHPMTTAAIIETGFLTNWSDRKLIAENPDVPAQALAEGIIKYLRNERLLT
jgi:hypothetical protein